MLKKMEKDGKIKCWDSQQQDRKKVYLISSMEPNSEIRGNQWEQDGDNFEIMNSLMTKVYDHLCHAIANGAPGKHLKELIQFMKSEGMDLGGQDEFKDEDLRRMVEVMVFD